MSNVVPFQPPPDNDPVVYARIWLDEDILADLDNDTIRLIPDNDALDAVEEAAYQLLESVRQTRDMITRHELPRQGDLDECTCPQCCPATIHPLIPSPPANEE